MPGGDRRIAVVGGGVVGCAVAHALARRGVGAIVLEAEPGLALGASGANSGILHTGFDSPPGELETRLILRSAELREELADELAPAIRCGARLTPAGEQERESVQRLAANAERNGVTVERAPADSVRVSGEAITDPVAYVHSLAAAARLGGAEIRLGARVNGLAAASGGGLTIRLAGGEELGALLAGEQPLEVYPRKGEFLVFRPPPGAMLHEILLPVPSPLGKGVLVFPTTDGHIIAGPTAREREDKADWSVEPDAAELIMARAVPMYPPLADAEAVDAYAGLRPAGRDANYVIERSRTLDGLIHVAAIRSTGLSASLGIGEHVAAMLAQHAEVELGPERPLAGAEEHTAAGPWWRRAASHHRDERAAGR